MSIATDASDGESGAELAVERTGEEGRGVERCEGESEDDSESELAAALKRPDAS